MTLLLVAVACVLSCLSAHAAPVPLGAEHLIRWRVGDQLLPASAFAARFHRPDLLLKQLIAS